MTDGHDGRLYTGPCGRPIALRCCLGMRIRLTQFLASAGNNRIGYLASGDRCHSRRHRADLHRTTDHNALVMRYAGIDVYVTVHVSGRFPTTHARGASLVDSGAR